MNLHVQDEVIFAAHQALGKQCTLVSRRSIEHQILGNPDLYPLLHATHQKSRRNCISQVMNSRYSLWSKTRGINQNSCVWIIRENREGEQ